MLKSIARICLVGSLAVAIAGLPLGALGQSTNKPAPTTRSGAKEASKGVKKSAHPFHGKLKAVDSSAKTIRVGESIYQITSETKITKAGKPATLADGVVGEEVGGYVKPTEDGKMSASSVRFGPKPEGKDADKKKTKAAN